VAEHALYCEMRLAGVCRSKHRRYVTNAGFEITYHIVPDSGSGPGIAEQGREIKGLLLASLELEPAVGSLVVSFSLSLLQGDLGIVGRRYMDFFGRHGGRADR
jgi:hypothetical protein